MKINKAFFSVVLCAGILVSVASLADDNVKHIKPVFYDEAQTAEYLTNGDYIDNFGTFDIQSRLHRNSGTLDDVKTLYKRQACSWRDEAINAVQSSLDKLNKNIDSLGYKLPLPENVPFMLTTMHEEGDAEAYTCKEGIALRYNIFQEETDFLIAHELFHVLSRNNQNFKREIYKLIGFEVLNNDIAVPDTFKNVMISNPDVEHHNTYAPFKIGGKSVDCAMFIYSDREYKGGSFFGYLNIGLLEIDKKKCSLVLKDGWPVIHEVSEAEDFYDKVGTTTDYIIDPEEILADNFANVLCGYVREGITQSIQELLLK